MARAIKGFHYGAYQALASRRGADVERMTPCARKEYLRQHLRLIETEIRVLSQKLRVDDPEEREGLSWIRDGIDEEKLESLASLHYLVVARDALRKTIQTL